MTEAVTMHIGNHSALNNDEWNTPAQYIEAARKVMGSIDVDPASNPVAQLSVRAKRFYSRENSGLAAEANWRGNLWMNPPYSRGLLGDFCSRLLAELEAGRVKQAIVLVNSGTETKPYQAMLSKASALCFPSKRIRFIRPTGEVGGNPNKGQTFFYFGDNPQGFSEMFSQFGYVWG
ncbi:DNA N-6-adenine-methyltransferase [Dongshaea marina]|uniref:DNA N-6-adenine-methyltransferase n=1 Tax=Dongshaea marina TaxID=2047966 RepID=UPI000D3EA904|nr:DNA N-6-adenine-methyltransferase [Dongshaea marina]